MTSRITGVLLAAGRGVRMRAVTGKPKALNTIGRNTLLGLALARFRGLTESVYVVVRECEDEFRHALRLGTSSTGAKTDLVCLSASSYVDSPIADLISLGRLTGWTSDDLLLVSYCDLVTDFDLRVLTERHASSPALMTMLLFQGNAAAYVHRYRLDEFGRVSIHAPAAPNARMLANGGIFMLKYGFLSALGPDRAIPFSVPDGPAARAHNLGRLYGCSTQGRYFREVGSPSGFHQCSAEVEHDDDLERALNPS